MKSRDRVPETTGSLRGHGVTLRYSRWQGGGAPIVVLHGGGQTRHAWEESCGHLGDLGYDVTALDLRGHGESEWAPNQEYGLMHFTADVVAVLPQLGHPRAALLGFSLGGLVSLYLTSRHPELCTALMLVDVAPRLETNGVRRIRDFMTRHESFGSLDEVVAALREYNPNRPPDSIRPESLERNLRQRPDGRWEWHYDRYFRTPVTDTADGAYRSRIMGLSHEELVAAARTVRVPTLVVRGATSDVLSEDGVRELLETIPHAEAATVERAGHQVAGDRNDAFLVALTPFLARAYPARAAHAEARVSD
ncbi:MAG: alpha/beta hydrolase [Deltaproteobacteria bacterium]|nr:alpha/beta hydrolase [Deltaproteobacteria bacterium]